MMVIACLALATVCAVFRVASAICLPEYALCLLRVISDWSVSHAFVRSRSDSA